MKQVFDQLLKFLQQGIAAIFHFIELIWTWSVDQISKLVAVPWPEWPLLAQTGSWNMGRACPLCPGTSDINLFCHCHSIIHFDAEISDRAFDFGVAEQRLHGSQVTIAPAN